MAEIRILTVNGGGIRGVIPALVLAEIEAQTGKKISELFHLIAGTSTGGILAAGLSGTSQGSILSASDLQKLYVERGQEIFGRSLWGTVTSADGMFEEKYNDRNLEKILKEIIGDTELSDIKTDLILTAYDIERRKPEIFKSWRARGEKTDASDPNEDRRTKNFLLRDAIRATTAAPTYFEPALIKNEAGEEFALIDGGVYANNPAMVAYSAARRIYHPLHDIFMLSIGTGTTDRPIPYKEAKGWGKIGWITAKGTPIISAVMDGVSDVANYHAEELLGHDFVRLDVDLKRRNDGSPTPSDDMDETSEKNIQALVERGKILLKENATAVTAVIQKFRNETLAPRTEIQQPPQP